MQVRKITQKKEWNDKATSDVSKEIKYIYIFYKS